MSKKPKLTSNDETAMLEVLIAFATENITTEEVCAALDMPLAQVRGLLRDAAQQGLKHAEKQRDAKLSFRLPTSEPKQVESSPAPAGPKDRLAQLMESSRIAKRLRSEES
ncbi:MAG TPA: hypothetical protein VJ302_09680 [Blastocatellia bacterium]|nr:hypothetical protein [Blastocatellia bacterium]